jgi:hypothetical protein
MSLFCSQLKKFSCLLKRLHNSFSISIRMSQIIHRIRLWTPYLSSRPNPPFFAKMSAASKDIELTEKKTDDGRPQRSNSRSSEAMSKRSNKGGGFGTDR